MKKCPVCHDGRWNHALSGRQVLHWCAAEGCKYRYVAKADPLSLFLLSPASLFAGLMKLRLSGSIAAPAFLIFILSAFSLWQLSLGSAYVHSLFPTLVPLLAAPVKLEADKNAHGIDRCELCRSRVGSNAVNQYDGKKFCSSEHLDRYRAGSRFAHDRRRFIRMGFMGVIGAATSGALGSTLRSLGDRSAPDYPKPNAPLASGGSGSGPEFIQVPSLSSDPALPPTAALWYRSDLGDFRGKSKSSVFTVGQVPFFVVSPRGPDDGIGDFGPNTHGTITCGMAEAMRSVQSGGGKVLVASGTYAMPSNFRGIHISRSALELEFQDGATITVPSGYAGYAIALTDGTLKCNFNHIHGKLVITEEGASNPGRWDGIYMYSSQTGANPNGVVFNTINGVHVCYAKNGIHRSLMKNGTGNIPYINGNYFEDIILQYCTNGVTDTVARETGNIQFDNNTFVNLSIESSNSNCLTGLNGLAGLGNAFFGCNLYDPPYALSSTISANAFNTVIVGGMLTAVGIGGRFADNGVGTVITDANYMRPYIYSRVTADQTNTAKSAKSTTMRATLLGKSVYAFRVTVFATNARRSTLNWQVHPFTHPTTTNLVYAAGDANAVAAVTAAGVNILANNQRPAGPCHYGFVGVVMTGASGDILQIDFIDGAGVGTATVKAGSYMTVEQVE